MQMYKIRFPNWKPYLDFRNALCLLIKNLCKIEFGKVGHLLPNKSRIKELLLHFFKDLTTFKNIKELLLHFFKDLTTFKKHQRIATPLFQKFDNFLKTSKNCYSTFSKI